MVREVRRHPLLRARIVLLDGGGRVLLAHHVHGDGRDFWCFPGGAAEGDEDVAAAARREAREETGLEPVLLGVIYLQDRPDDGSFEVFLLGRPGAGQFTLGTDPERAGGPAVLQALEWVPLAELPRRRVLPEGLAGALADGRYATWGLLPLPGG